jgi:hypothetical protein
LASLVRDAVLTPGGLVNRDRDNPLFELARDAVPQVGFPAADLTQRFFATSLVQFLEAIETVAAIAHHLAGLRHVP